MNCWYPNGDQEEILVWPVLHNHICSVIHHTILNCVFPIFTVFLQIEGEMLQGLKVDFSSPAIHYYPKKQRVKLQVFRGWVYWHGRWYRRVYKLQLQHECTFCKLTLKHSQNHLHIWLIKESKRFPIVPIWSKFVITSHIGYISFEHQWEFLIVVVPLEQLGICVSMLWWQGSDE